MLHNAASYIIPGIAVIVAAAGATAYFRATADSATKKYLTDAVRARDIAISDKDKEIASITAASDQKDQTIAELKRHNAYLQRIKRGGPEITALTAEFVKWSAVIAKAVGVKLGDGKNQ